MILSWCRLRCPACAARYEGPAARKMSATSSEVRPGSAAGGLRFGCGQRQSVERTDDRPHRLRRHLGVEGSGVELGVTEQRLDDADINPVLEQMGSEAVPQGVWSHPLGDIRCFGRLDDDA